MSMWSLVCKGVLSSSLLEQAILLILSSFSVFSWALILMKWRAFTTARRNGQAFLDLFDSAEDVTAVLVQAPACGGSLIKDVFDAAIETWEQTRQPTGPRYSPGSLNEKILMGMQHTLKASSVRLRWGLSYLASLSSASPFIGLFGTVVGIMATFQNLGDSKSASLAVVAPGISAALIATAAGLAVAIPAVMAYNWLLGQLNVLEETAGNFGERLGFVLRHEGHIGGKARVSQDAPLLSSQPAPLEPALQAAPASGER